MNSNIKMILRLAGIGLIFFGILANLPQGWSIATMVLGFLGLIAGGGGG